MKTIILTISILLTTVNSLAQLNIAPKGYSILIGKHLYMNASQIELLKDTLNGSYIFYYKDAEYQKLQDWKTFTINNEKSTNQLYELCTKMITDKSNESISIELEDKTTLIVSYTKSWKGITFSLYNSAGTKSSTAPPMKQTNLNALFGKK